ncbi:RNA polymerase sigma factor [Emticicia sp. BO119]|uniref:RNA polymerase sigma factor n=1 Tax=Emticicia sp. BO119 TaxID=2757768 RepID=UPI0015F03430|nr:sigma-70 family RNA polymerase sigma factor [Emticicia sp. BO119]MBA4853847.1 sigma-70 family RNA polymerase sigma factor [Emticicia sp. BO119]
MFQLLPNDADSEIIEGILKGGRERKKCENALFEKYLYFIKEGARKHQIEDDEAASVYSDTILNVIDHIAHHRFEGRASLKTYIFQIFSNQCVSLIRKKTTNKAAPAYDTVLLSEIMHVMSDNTQSIIQHIIEKEEETTLLQRLTTIGKKCKELLLLWANGYSDKEILSLLTYSSVDVVKVTRMRCIDKLRKIY